MIIYDFSSSVWVGSFRKMMQQRACIGPWKTNFDNYPLVSDIISSPNAITKPAAMRNICRMTAKNESDVKIANGSLFSQDKFLYGMLLVAG